VSLIFNHQRRPENLFNYRFIDHFYEDVKDEQRFPDFALIEPKYAGQDQNDDHPPHNIMKGEKLIADLFNAIRSNAALWTSTLFIVTFDEHGGFYDHVPPPNCVNPDGKIASLPGGKPFDFTRLGVRVPALLISPYTGRRVEHTPFDHTSILKYFTDKWNLRPLGGRTAAANSIGVAITQSTVTSVRVSYTDLIAPNPAFEANDDSAHHGALDAFAAFLHQTEDAAQVGTTKAASTEADIWSSLGAALGKSTGEIGTSLKDDLEAFIAREDKAKARGAAS
jgi:phospholipase C